MPELKTRFDKNRGSDPRVIKAPSEITYPEYSILWIIQRWCESVNIFAFHTNVIFTSYRTNTGNHSKLLKPVVGYISFWDYIPPCKTIHRYTTRHEADSNNYPEIIKGVYKHTRFDLATFRAGLRYAYDGTPIITIDTQLGFYRSQHIMYTNNLSLDVDTLSGHRFNRRHDNCSEVYWSHAEEISLKDREEEKGAPVIEFIPFRFGGPSHYIKYRLTRYKSNKFRAEVVRSPYVGWVRCNLEDWWKDFMKLQSDRFIKEWVVEPTPELLSEIRVEVVIGEL